MKSVSCATDFEHYAAVAKGELSAGAVVLIVLRGSMERFDDTITAVKVPSFGTRFTVLLPLMYLAYYDLVANAEGRAFCGWLVLTQNLFVYRRVLSTMMRL